MPVPIAKDGLLNKLLSSRTAAMLPYSVLLLLIICVVQLRRCDAADGILYPQASEKRQLNSLDGLWNFRAVNQSKQNQGFDEQWFNRPLKQSGATTLMPVPSSYNDVTQEASLRDHIGWVWYDREFYVAEDWANQNYVFVRFGSASYHSIVWVNGQQMTEHSGGFLPFQADVTSSLNYGALNRITVAINNTLTDSTLPQGAITYFNSTAKYPPGYVVQNYDFDWFNFGGIHRPVYLYTVPKSAYVDDINVTCTLPNANTAFVSYGIGLKGVDNSNAAIDLKLFDQDGALVTQSISASASGLLAVSSPHLWWPQGMSTQVGYLYTLQVIVKDRSSGSLIDSYRIRIGLRELRWDANGVYVNGKRIYFKGFGRHEDSILRGRGLDLVTLVKDFNLMRWTGANSFRTSHYPYSEELMDLADEQGFMIIDEVPACTITAFNDELKANHLSTLVELYNRDKNRPSVIMWSVANEADTTTSISKTYFNEISSKVRSLDAYRPVTIVLNKYVTSDQVGSFFDVICVNKYYGWYSDAGLLDLITYQLVNDLTLWWQRYGKPIVVTEYGADTIPGLHQDPSFVWTEDFQLDLMTQNFAAFDDVYAKGYLIGEMIWNFADFATKQDVKRAVINRKGIFTRERQPKASARHLKQRYTQLNH